LLPGVAARVAARSWFKAARPNEVPGPSAGGLVSSTATKEEDPYAWLPQRLCVPSG
jgi:hypothetical protein